MSNATNQRPRRAPTKPTFTRRVLHTTVLTAALQPLAYSKVLMQVGYEPFPPRPITTIGSLLGFQKKPLGYPSVISYCKLIKQRQGWIGLFTTGLFSEVCSSLISSATYSYVIGELTNMEARSSPQNQAGKELSEFEKFKSNTTNSIIATSLCVVVTQPFHVISIRQMASFVGGESVYRTFLSSLSEIYAQEGIRGFFAGCTARLFAEVSKAALICSLTYTGKLLLRKLMGPAEPGQPDPTAQLLPQIVTMVATTATYSFTLVANLMALTDSRLVAATQYRNAMDCYEQLAARGELKRGAQFFFRTVPVPPLPSGRKLLKLTGALDHSALTPAASFELC